MSTLYKNSSGTRLSVLIATRKTLFHTDDLALLWNIHNSNTLRITVQRAIEHGWLHAVQRGLYSLYPPKEISPEVLGSACMHRYCYVSTETVLRDTGIIQQNIVPTTFVSSISRKWEISGRSFISRQIHSRYLHNTTGILQEGEFLLATPTRAIADMLYFDPWYHFDAPIDWASVKQMQKAIGYSLTPHRYADSSKT